MNVMKTDAAETSVGRTFLTGFGFGALLAFLFDPVSGRRRRHLLLDRAVHLKHLSTDMARKAAVDECDLSEIARDTVQHFSAAASRADCKLFVRADEPVCGVWDRLRLEQSLTNLLANAIKYGAGKPVEVSVHGDRESAIVSVRDYGIGISAVDRERIFGRFERAAPVTNYGGLGLGLYIVRQIAEAHGGKIRVTSTPGGGAHFEIELPRQRPV